MDIGNLLEGLGSIDPEIRRSCEDHLNTFIFPSDEGCISLVNVISQSNIPIHHRQLAALLLKKVITEHWSELSLRYIENTFLLRPAVKDFFKTNIFTCLRDACPKIQTAVSLAISSIAVWDFPQQWPGLLSTLSQMILAKDPISICSGVRCLDLLVSDTHNLSNESIPLFFDHIFPHLFSLFHQRTPLPNGNDTLTTQNTLLRKQIVHIFLECLHWLGEMKKNTKCMLHKKLLPSFLPDWCWVFALAFQESELTNNFSLKILISQVFMIIMTEFSPLAPKAIELFLPLLWSSFLSCSHPFVEGVVCSSAYSVETTTEYPSGFETFVSTLLEVLSSFLSRKKKHRLLLRDKLSVLVNTSLHYLQMTANQAAIWLEDANQYVADHDDEALFSFSTRNSAMDLLSQIPIHFGEEGITCILSNVQGILDQSLVTSGESPFWWKLREAGELALCVVADSIIDFETYNTHVTPFLKSIIQTDIHIQEKLEGAAQHDRNVLYSKGFLLSRSLLLAAKCSVNIGGSTDFSSSLPLLLIASRRLSKGSSPIQIPLLIGAAKYIEAFRDQMSDDITSASSSHQSIFLNLLDSVATILSDATEETLILLISTVHTLLKINPTACSHTHQRMIPLLIDIWLAHPNDHLTSQDCVDTLGLYVNQPNCRHLVLVRLVPVIHSFLVQREETYSGLIQDSLILMRAILLAYRADNLFLLDIHEVQGILCEIFSLLEQSHDPEILECCYDFFSLLILTHDVRYFVAPPLNLLQFLLRNAVTVLSNPEEHIDITAPVSKMVGTLFTLPTFASHISPSQQDDLISRICGLLMSNTLENHSYCIQSLLLVISRLLLFHSTEDTFRLLSPHCNFGILFQIYIQSHFLARENLSRFEQTIFYATLVSILSQADSKYLTLHIPISTSHKTRKNTSTRPFGTWALLLLMEKYEELIESAKKNSCPKTHLNSVFEQLAEEGNEAYEDDDSDFSGDESIGFDMHEDYSELLRFGDIEEEEEEEEDFVKYDPLCNIHLQDLCKDLFSSLPQPLFESLSESEKKTFLSLQNKLG